MQLSHNPGHRWFYFPRDGTGRSNDLQDLRFACRRSGAVHRPHRLRRSQRAGRTRAPARASNPARSRSSRLDRRRCADQAMTEAESTLADGSKPADPHGRRAVAGAQARGRGRIRVGLRARRGLGLQARRLGPPLLRAQGRGRGTGRGLLAGCRRPTRDRSGRRAGSCRHRQDQHLSRALTLSDRGRAVGAFRRRRAARAAGGAQEGARPTRACSTRRASARCPTCRRQSASSPRPRAR